MKERIAYRKKVEEFLATLDPYALSYNKDEYWMIFSLYEYLEYYSFEHRLWNTCIALPLSRGLFDGKYRKSTLLKNGSSYRLPYVIHCLRVSRMLADLHLPFSSEERDIMLAAALCHDMLEDLDFSQKGEELVTEYHLDPRVLETVKLVTKEKNFTEAQTKAHFKQIQENPVALLVKLSDRSHNVEDLYNMTIEKVDEYIGETNTYILPMCEYGLAHYPKLGMALEILKDKIICLTQAAKILIEKYEMREAQLQYQLKELRIENEKLFQTLHRLWERKE